MFRSLLNDFLAQRWAMKIALLIGWLCVLIMVCALFAPYYQAVVDSYFAWSAS